MSVQQKVQLPRVCVSVDTALGDVLSYADKLRPWEGIPVLDVTTRPVGMILSTELFDLKVERRDPTLPLKYVMSRSFATVFPCMSLVDAAQLRGLSDFRGVVVTSENEQFLGVVWEPELERACTLAAQLTTGSP